MGWNRKKRENSSTIARLEEMSEDLTEVCKDLDHVIKELKEEVRLHERSHSTHQA
jgi:hypothetical protein